LIWFTTVLDPDGRVSHALVLNKTCSFTGQNQSGVTNERTSDQARATVQIAVKFISNYSSQRSVEPWGFDSKLGSSSKLFGSEGM